MIKEKIIKYFARDLELKVLFFFDPEENWLQEIKEIEINDVRILFWQNNDFFLKSQLYGPLKNEKVFLYFPFAPPSLTDDYLSFPLLGLLMANKILSLEDEAEFIQEYGLLRNQSSLVKKYIRELMYSHIQEVCKPILNPSNFEENTLIRALISAFLKSNKIESWPVILAKTLSLSHPDEEAELRRFQKKIADNKLIEPISSAAKEWLGAPLNDLQPSSLKNLLSIINYNQITNNITKAHSLDPYSSLKIRDKAISIRFMQFLLEIKQNERFYTSYKKALHTESKMLHSENFIRIYGVQQQFAYYTPEMTVEICAQLLDKIELNPSMVRSRFEEINLNPDHNQKSSDLIHLVLLACSVLEAINSIPTYILDTPDAYITSYTTTWYKIDLAYRKAITVLQNADLIEIPKQAGVEIIREKLNAKYQKHSDKMNREWLKCMNQFEFNFHKLHTPKQFEFFQKFIAPYDQKTVVIISDALRYEAASELLSEMHTDPKNTAVLNYQLASLPSKTFVGMAQLLPGKKHFSAEAKITIDGISTEGIENRSKILQQINPEAIAISFKDINDMPHEARRTFFKKPLVYIFHDVIDATGDKTTTEHRAFSAVSTAFEELKRLVKNLHASQNVSRVIITADHGFIYNDRKIEEADKETMPTDETLLSGNRFALTDNKITTSLGYCIPLKATTNFDCDLYITTPESVNRYKKQGVSHQFAHGGGSLQELIVPIIESSRKEVPVSSKVQVILLQKNLSFVSNSLQINMLQENKVSRNEKEREILAGIYANNDLASNQISLLLNASSDNPSERMYRLNFTLSSKAFDQNILKLKIFDAEDLLNPLIETRVENKNLIEPDF